MGSISQASIDGEWTGRAVLVGLTPCAGFIGLAAMYAASRPSPAGKRFAAPRRGHGIIVVPTVPVFGLPGSLVLPQLFATA